MPPLAERFECANCQHTVALDEHGRCPMCGSEAVISLAALDRRRPPRPPAPAPDSLSGHRRRQVLAYLRRVGAASCEEIEHALGFKYRAAAAVLRELRAQKVILAVGRRQTRLGARAAVYRVASGYEEL